ncbi:DUF4097 domain-containing protein [Eubacteriales bacterium OttesenSCG-928-A19]|nr:DUF4097 domain-containing protein [Eubacteriales bacterium OttesenSCG-928-A19]
MKKTRILVLLTLTVGLALFLGGSALAADRYEEQSYEVEDPAAIQSIDITDTDVPIEVRPSADGGMYVSYYTSEYVKYDIGVDNGTLHIIKREPIRIGISWDFWNHQSVKLTLFLPDGYTGSLQMETADGDIRIDSIAASGAILATSDGNVHISRCRFSGDADIKTFDGNIRMDMVEAANLTLQTNDGDIFIDRPIFEGSLACRAFDGNIGGTLTGSAADYTLAVMVADGHTNVSSGGNGAKLCDMKTMDGNIAIFFERD